jgi:hypothetical protein
MSEESKEIEHLREMLLLQYQILETRMNAADTAIHVYEKSMQEWKVGHNEWRRSLEDSRGDTLSRSEINARFDAVAARIDAHERSINEQRGRASGYNNSWLILTVILGLIGSALLVIVEMKK